MPCLVLPLHRLDSDSPTALFELEKVLCKAFFAGGLHILQGSKLYSLISDAPTSFLDTFSTIRQVLKRYFLPEGVLYTAWLYPDKAKRMIRKEINSLGVLIMECC